MSDKFDFDVDAALRELAADAAASTPRPGADLVARVLADAATVAAKTATPQSTAARPASQGFGLRLIFSGWRAGATAAAALALAVGIGIGMQIDDELPMMSAGDEPETEFFSADSGFLPEDLL